MKKDFYSILLSLLVSVGFAITAEGMTQGKKREFRGVWIQCVNGQFEKLGTENMKRTLAYQLDELKKDGVNAIMFQVRGECDALYDSPYEPWSRFLTGEQGVAPSPYWDPLRWMITECHKRGMELHAWVNPYRAKTKSTNVLAANHVAIKHPERVFAYGNQLILNPGNPANREYIYKVVSDIVRRYDVDGIHMDDYFYPYPAAGEAIPDEREFKLYNNGIADKGDWRRDNVNVLIKQLSDSIHHIKPWVKFGVSPFGIYRNKKSAPLIGSETSGLQNYDDLYADVLLWVNNGWVDYCVPQLYWEIGHPTADYEKLIVWWNKYAKKRPLFIGEDIVRTTKFPDKNNPNNNQMNAKFNLHNRLPYINGMVLWYAKAAVDNIGNYGTVLRDYYWKYPALQPLMPFIDAKVPKKPKKVKTVWTNDGYILFWQQPKGSKWDDVVEKYVVYRFEDGERIDLENPTKIVTITGNTYYKLPFVDGNRKCIYVVTSLDKMSNESKGSKKCVKL